MEFYVSCSCPATIFLKSINKFHTNYKSVKATHNSSCAIKTFLMSTTKFATQPQKSGSQPQHFLLNYKALKVFQKSFGEVFAVNYKIIYTYTNVRMTSTNLFAQSMIEANHLIVCLHNHHKTDGQPQSYLPTNLRLSTKPQKSEV